ncbi:MAG: hypothetical protein J6B13_02065 [Muribaculaceae bacterium]|nr:hypothetical protein [Muribaculaceae bacterium]
MKKALFLMLLPLLMACSNETDGPQQEDPDNKPNDKVVAEDVEPLPTLKSIDVSADEKEVLNALMEVSFDINSSLAQQLELSHIENNNSNYCLSPISIVACMSLIANSLDSPKKEEMVKMLGCDNIEELNMLNKKLLQYLPAPENGVDMRIANSTWYHNGLSVTDAYRNLMADNFGAPVYGRNFKDIATPAEMDSWIEKNTNGMIKDIIKGIPNSIMIMWINAMYFEGCWSRKFDVANTTKATFNGTNGESTVEMMKKTEVMEYAETMGLKMVSIPFKGENYYLDIILPTDDQNDVTTLLNTERYKALINDQENHKINLELPKFKQEMTADLSTVLTSMGMPHHDLRFTGIGFPENYVYNNIDVLHAAKFEVDENGAKAAAVTVSTVTSTGEEPEYKEIDMVVDRPFFYIIRNHRTGALVMMGNVKNL